MWQWLCLWVVVAPPMAVAVAVTVALAASLAAAVAVAVAVAEAVAVGSWRRMLMKVETSSNVGCNTCIRRKSTTPYSGIWFKFLQQEGGW